MKTWTILFVAILALVLGCGGSQPAPTEPTSPDGEPAAPAVTPTEPTEGMTGAPDQPQAEPPKPVVKTPENLQTAYAAETNTMARYKAFAEAATKEGYKNVGKLFRAAARSADVHAKKIGDIITAAGGTPNAGTAAPEVKTTAENLKAALDTTAVERDTMYMSLAETAKTEGNADAEKLFSGIKSVKAEQAKLFEDAEKNLAAWKKGAKKFWVCPVCGNVATSNKAPCGVCSAPAKDLEAIK